MHYKVMQYQKFCYVMFILQCICTCRSSFDAVANLEALLWECGRGIDKASLMLLRAVDSYLEAPV